MSTSEDGLDLPVVENEAWKPAKLNANTQISAAYQRGPDATKKSQQDAAKSSASSLNDAELENNEEEQPSAAEVELEEKRREKCNAWLESAPVIVGIAEYVWENFMNRYGDSESHGRHIIEVLRVGPDDLGEVQKQPMTTKAPKSVDDSSAGRKGTSGPASSTSWIQRVRVQSPIILAHLRHAGLESDPDDDGMPHVFIRPFRALSHVQSKMKDSLAKLEMRWGTKVSPRMSNQASVKPHLLLDFPEGVPDTLEALEHMRHFVIFIEEHIIPLYSMFNEPNKTKVRFNDLTFLFRPGELVYQPPRVMDLKTPYQRRQSVWRIADIRRTAYRTALPDDMDLCTSDAFDLACYCLDYDGVNYGATFTEMTIPCYLGEQDITKLPIYPLRFLNNSATITANLKQRGTEFCSFIKERHLYHDGWSIPDEPREDNDETRFRMPELRRNHPEYIQSAVVIDYEECFKQNPQWKAVFEPIPDYSQESSWSASSVRIQHWGDRTEVDQEVDFYITETYLHNDTTSSTMHQERLAKTHSILATLDGGFLKVQEEDLVLLPRVLVGYSLRDRKFVFVDIESLQLTEKRADIFEDLKIDPKHERVIKSLVRGHFETRKAEANSERAQISLSQDLVYGKGSGLFILLHGPPGVGKTATAEAVAQHHDKPLFSITCGDLGLSPREVETELKSIFRLAHLWDCVLLLDEADVFLARRDIASLQRNALVSVFLRVLEYYTGILFLTTNRVGLIDEAFKSRIHLSLLYPKLNRLRTLEIFRVNIKRLRAIEEEKTKRASESKSSSGFQRLTIRDDEILYWADSHYQNSASYARWNGRQIRNAFQIAASMVRYDTPAATQPVGASLEAESSITNDNDKRPTESITELFLGREQFETVAIMTGLFEDYFQSATGEDDELAAQLDGFRADGWKSHQSRPSQAPPARNSPNPRSGAARPAHGDVRREGFGSSSSQGYSQESFARQRPAPGPGRQTPQAQRPARARSGQEETYQYRADEQDDYYSNEEPLPRRGPRPAATTAATPIHSYDRLPVKESYEPPRARDFQQTGRRKQVYHEDYDEDEYNDMEERSYEAERYAY
ncbi:hypothetical protein BD289DRAFT_480304 [Coniella lustricola]|uniref:AAA+ ATPase domain-containing protein n=1 Tax=Coniella lustricola TaxID=2025994 RepID=A0A2T3AG89_9PEZI|nr:hypothetical protein BD289DRAFT_480304 [Coniella lustricola]